MNTSVDRLALRAVLILASLIAVILIGWRFAPVAREKAGSIARSVAAALSNATQLPLNTTSGAANPVVSLLTPAPTSSSEKRRATAKDAFTPEPEFREAVRAVQSSAKRVASPTPVAMDWQGRPWVNRHASTGAQGSIPRGVPPDPVGQPYDLHVQVPSGKWSKLVTVPPNRRASVTFLLGRMRVERNGVDLGVFFRNPTVTATKTSPGVVEGTVRPLTIFDRSPRTIEFDSGTQTLRFLSLERDSQSVLVEFQ